MQHIITAKLKLITTPEQFALLRQTQLAYRDALNAVSVYAFEHGKTSSADRLQKGMYTEIRMSYKLPHKWRVTCRVRWGNVQWTVDQAQAEHRASSYQANEETLQGLRPTTQVRLTHAHVQLWT